MKDLIYLGKITSTHGIKGEIKIKSSFEYKEKAFRIGNKILINKDEYVIKSYRRHKDYEMITLEGFNDINEVLFLLKNNVYINKEELKLEEEVLDNDLLEYKVLLDNKEGHVKEVFLASPKNKIIRIEIDKKELLIPYIKEFITIDKKNKIIYIKVIDGMIL